MIKSLWTAKTGLESQQVKMDVISNNLANVSTNGFKKSRAVFEDLLYQNLRQPGGANDVQNTLPSGMQVGSGVRPVATERLHSQGGLENTGNSRDLAINGKGFFQVRMPDGNVAFTRDGSFQLDQNGQMVTSSGYPLEPAVMGANLIFRRRVLAGSLIGGIPETQEVLDFCAEKGITCDVEMIDIQDINEAWERMQKGDVRYRFVIDMASMKNG